MPTFTVYVRRQTRQYNSFEVEAKDESEAEVTALEWIALENAGETFNQAFHLYWRQTDDSGCIELDEIIDEDEDENEDEDEEQDVPLAERGFGEAI